MRDLTEQMDTRLKPSITSPSSPKCNGRQAHCVTLSGASPTLSLKVGFLLKNIATISYAILLVHILSTLHRS